MSDDEKKKRDPEAAADDADQSAPTAGRSARRRSERRLPRAKPATVYDTIESAAAKLDTTAVALRALCRRHQGTENGEIVARLGRGIFAIKLHNRWRVRITVE